MTSELFLFRLVGYGLLVLTIFDIVSAFVPPQFSNPGWFFETAGGFVERSAVPLIGLVMAFYGNQEGRKKRELLVLNGLSWISLLAGAFYLGLLVICFVTPMGLNDRMQSQINSQFEPKIAQVKQLQAQVEKATPEQLSTLMKNAKGSNITDPQVFKAKLLQDATTMEKNLSAQSDITKGGQKTALLKNTVKWGLGALVSAVLFLRIWAATSWARQ